MQNKKIFIKLRQNTKLPAERWSEIKYTQEEAIKLFENGFNIGLATGKDSFLVIDADCVEGINNFEKFARENNISINTLITTTPRGGRHYFYRWTNSCDGITVYTNFLKNVDIRGQGGYVVVPPSQIDNKQYVVYNNVEAIECSEILAQKIKEKFGIVKNTKQQENINDTELTKKQQDILEVAVREYNIENGIQEGERDDKLIKIVGWVFRKVGGREDLTKKIVQKIYDEYVEDKSTFTQKELDAYIFSRIPTFDKNDVEMYIDEDDKFANKDLITDKNIIDKLKEEMKDYFIVNEIFYKIDREKRTIKKVGRVNTNKSVFSKILIEKIIKQIEKDRKYYTTKEYEKVYTEIKQYRRNKMPDELENFLTIDVASDPLSKGKKVVVNGYEYDLVTGEIKDVIEEKEKMYMCNIDVKLEDKDTPAWDKFLLHIFGNNEQRKIWFEKVLAHTLARKGPGTGRNYIFYLHGKGGRGKTSLKNIIEYLFDEKIVSRMNKEYILEGHQQNNHASTSWYSAQFIFCDELYNKRIDMQRLYDVSSGDIKVNPKFKRDFDYYTRASLFLISNFDLQVVAESGVGPDLLRRIQLVEFGYINKMPEEEYDELIRKVKEERGAIVNKLLKLAMIAVNEELPPSPDKEAADKNIIAMNDYEHGFLNDFFDITNNRDDCVYAAHVYSLYSYFKDKGKTRKDVSSNRHHEKFYNILKENFSIQREKNNKVLVGLRYKKDITTERLMDIDDLNKIKNWAAQGKSLCEYDKHISSTLRKEYIKIFEYIMSLGVCGILEKNIFDGGDDNDGGDGGNGGGNGDNNDGGDENKFETETEKKQLELVAKPEENYDDEEKKLAEELNLEKETYTKKEVIKMIKDLKNEFVTTMKEVIKEVVPEVVKQEISTVQEEKQKEEVKETKEIKKEEKIENQQQQLNLDIKQTTKKDVDKEINDFIKEQDIVMDKDMQAFANHLKTNCNKPALDYLPTYSNKPVELNDKKEEKKEEESAYKKMFFENGELKPSEEKLKKFEKETFPEVDWNKPPFLKFDY